VSSTSRSWLRQNWSFLAWTFGYGVLLCVIFGVALGLAITLIFVVAQVALARTDASPGTRLTFVLMLTMGALRTRRPNIPHRP
jgi:hypothetical protein